MESVRQARRILGRGRDLARLLVIAAIFAAGRLPAATADDANPPPLVPYFSRIVPEASWLRRIRARPDGSVCVAGRTSSPALPNVVSPAVGTDPQYRDFIAVLEPHGAFRWSRYVPHSDSVEICVAPDGGIWVASAAWATVDGEPRVRVVKLTADGALLFESTFGGSSGPAAVSDIALAPNGDVVVSGATSAADFEVAGGGQTEFGGDADGFVARIRGDGSGVAWSTFLGGPGRDEANAVAVTADDDVFVTTREIQRDRRYGGETEFSLPLVSVSLLRLTPDGRTNATVDVPAGEFGGAHDLAIGIDGRLFVGGVSHQDGSTLGYVRSIDPRSLAWGPSWTSPGREVHRVAVSPDGSLLLGMDRHWYDLVPGAYRQGGFVHVAADLRTVLRSVDREQGWDITDVDAAPDGAHSLVGMGGGAAVRFPDSGDSPRWTAPFAARLPAVGVRAPSRVRATRIGATDVALAWPDDGDAAVSFRIEESLRDASQSGRWYVPIGPTVPGSGNAVRLRGLLPAEIHEFRLVATFASGARSEVVAPPLQTLPAAVRRLDVRPWRYGGIALRWVAPGGTQADFEVERRIGHGPFEPARGSLSDRRWSPRRRSLRWIDIDGHSLHGAWVTYRVRTVTSSPRHVTSWHYTTPIFVR